MKALVDVGYKFLFNKLKVLWKPSGTMDMVHLGFGFFQIRFRTCLKLWLMDPGSSWIITY